MLNFLKRIFSSKRRGFFVIFDVSTSSIRSFLFERGPQGIVGLKKQITSFSQKQSESEDFSVLGNRLKDILFRFIKTLGKIPVAVVIGVEDRVVTNVLESVKFTRADPKKDIDTKEIENYIKNAADARKEIIQKGESFVLADAKLTHVEIDGYKYDLHEERVMRGTIVTLFLMFTYIHRSLARELVMMKNAFGGLTISIHANQSLVALRLIERDPEDECLLIKIGATTTEVSAIKDRTLQWTQSFPIGGLTISEAIAKELNITKPQAEDMKRQFGSLALPAATSDIIQSVISEYTKNWITNLVTVVKDQRSLVPAHIYLYGGGSQLESMKIALTDAEWAQTISFSAMINVEVLNGEDFLGKFFTNAILNGPEDVDLAILAMNTIALYERVS